MRKEYLEAPKVAWACLTRPLDALACATTWNIPTLAINDSSMGMVDVILAMEMGQGVAEDGGGVPVQSNLEIARIADMARKVLDTPIYAQDETAMVLRHADSAAEFEFIRAGEYADSYEVIKKFAALCSRSRFRRVLVVSHSSHQWRVMRSCARLGLVPYATDCSTVPCDQNSLQDWTRSEEKFRSYELKARMFFLGRGYI